VELVAIDPRRHIALRAGERAAAERAIDVDRAVRDDFGAVRDLILTKLVANGSEVIADGSIHVYGALRGRALAGAQGDASARIYCHEFHAELVSIAGQYRVFETMPDELKGQRVQAWLDGDKLVVQKL